MIREVILNTKLFITTFIFSSFAYVSDLPDCTSALMLIMMTAIMIVILVILLWLLLSLLGVFSPLLGL